MGGDLCTKRISSQYYGLITDRKVTTNCSITQICKKQDEKHPTSRQPEGINENNPYKHYSNNKALWMYSVEFFMPSWRRVTQGCRNIQFLIFKNLTWGHFFLRCCYLQHPKKMARFWHDFLKPLLYNDSQITVRVLFGYRCRDEATRTPDPYVPNVVRYQLRYIPIYFFEPRLKGFFLAAGWLFIISLHWSSVSACASCPLGIL